VTRPIVRIGLVALAVATSSEGAARSVLCDTVKLGDTASAMARRLTGSRESVQQPWFRIVDPSTSKVIPKAAYNRILAGWQACIPAAHVRLQPSRFDPIGTSGRSAPVKLPFDDAQPAQEASADAPREVPGVLKLVLVLLGPPVFGAAIGFAWQGMERFLTLRRSLKREVQEFGELFLSDFERPLLIAGASSPIRTRLRWMSFSRRLEILLAPAGGRRYPNLEDHRRNVEYDVDRIAHRLRDRPWVPRPLRAEGEWVVVPFQLKSRPQTGVRR
jgi:hypothetical protein